MNSNKIIGLTGGIGTGKSTAAAYLVSRGMRHIDADAISRDLTKKVPGVANPVLEEIGRAFAAQAADGDENNVLTSDGALDRKAMARLVFSDPARKKLLEDILFREIIAEIRRQIDEASLQQPQACPVLLDAPLLFETGLDSLCDHVILLTTDHDLRIRRVMRRDGCTADDVEARIANQMSDEEKGRLADFIVDNSGTREDLKERLWEVCEEMRI